MMKQRYHIKSMLSGATRQGWTLSANGAEEANGWRLARDGEMLYVNVNPHWLYFSQPIAESWGEDSARYTYLLQMCRRCFMCKYSLDGIGQLLLQLELPLVGLERCYCHKALEALGVYAERHTGVISRAKGERSGAIATGTKPDIDSDEIEIFSLETLGLYFRTIQHEGWAIRDRLERLGPNHWHAVYKSYDRSFDVYLSFNPSWAYFQVPLLSGASIANLRTASFRGVLYSYLLQLNAQVYWAKFGLDENGQVLLMLDVPVEVFDLERFRWATRTLASYANDFFYEIQILANLEQDRRLSALLSDGTSLGA